MKRNGKTKSGSQRWRCVGCGASATHSIDTAARDLAAFVGWLLSKESQVDMPGQGRTFRRRCARFWAIWPMPEAVDEACRVVYVDGIWVASDCVVLIACSDEFVLSWHLARAETTAAWRSLLSRVAAPEVVVTDGGSGFAAAVAAEWPSTKVQRCVFHAFCQVKRQTTTRPKLQAGIELYGLAKELLHIETLAQAEWWLERLGQWCGFWADFLEQRSVVDGRSVYAHERLRRARSGLVRLANAGALFTYLDPALAAEGPLPATNNRIEGGVNAQLGSVLRFHRGSRSSSGSRRSSGGATCTSSIRDRWRTPCARCPPMPTSTCSGTATASRPMASRSPRSGARGLFGRNCATRRGTRIPSTE